MLETELTRGQSAGARADERRAGRLGRVVEALLLAGVLALACWLRFDRLMTVPAFTDETMEVQLALDYLRDGRLNLVGVSSFLGGFHTWLLMSVLALFPGAEMGPRLLSLAAGVLTVLATYALGREIAGRWGGLLAAALLATNLSHIAINSRIAWSNCVTPLFTTLGLWLIVRALRRDAPRLLVPAGLALGLGLQTHPAALALYPGLALGILLSPTGRGWLRRPWPWLALLAALLAYANVLWFNLTSGGKSLAAAQERDYAVHPVQSAGELAGNLGALLVQLARNLGSSFVAAPAAPEYPLTVAMIGVIGLALAGLGIALWRRQWLLPVLLLGGVVLMAAIGGEYKPVPHSSSRYLAPLWPALLALAGLGAVALGRVVVANTPRSPLRWTGLAVVAATCLLLVVQPALTTRAYLDWYGRQPWLGDSNAFALAISNTAAERAPGGRVYIDSGLHEDKNTDAGTMFRSLSMLLRINGSEPVSLPQKRAQSLAAVWKELGERPGLAVLASAQAERLEGEGVTLTRIGGETRVVDPAQGDYRLYEVRR